MKLETAVTQVLTLVFTISRYVTLSFIKCILFIRGNLKKKRVYLKTLSI